MNKQRGRSLVRTSVKAPMFYRVFNTLFAALFATVVFLAVFFNNNTFYVFGMLGLLLAALCGVAVAFALSRLFELLPIVSKSVERIVVCVFFALLIAWQGYVGWQGRVDMGLLHEFGAAAGAAQQFVLHGSVPDVVFLGWDNSIGLYTLLCGWYSLFSLFGFIDFTIPSLLLNILAIDGSLLLLYFCGRRLFGVKKALLLLAAALLLFPFWGYASLVCAETLAMPAPVGCVFVWLKARAYWREGNKRKAATLYIVMSLVAALASLVHAPVLVIWVAATIDLLVLLSGKGRALVLLAGVAAGALVLGLGLLVLRHTPLIPANREMDIPVNAGIMMGLAERGVYHGNDTQDIFAQDAAVRGGFVWGEAGNRISALGIGYLGFLADKLSHVFGEGTFYAAGYLGDGAVQPGWLQDVFAYTGEYFGVVAYCSFAALAAALVWMMVAAVKAIVRGNDALTVLRLAIFGMVLYLLLTPALPQYWLAYLPLVLLAAVEAAPMPRLALQKQRVQSGMPVGRNIVPDGEETVAAVPREMPEPGTALEGRWEQAGWETNGSQYWEPGADEQEGGSQYQATGPVAAEDWTQYAEQAEADWQQVDLAQYAAMAKRKKGLAEQQAAKRLEEAPTQVSEGDAKQREQNPAEVEDPVQAALQAIEKVKRRDVRNMGQVIVDTDSTGRQDTAGNGTQASEIAKQNMRQPDLSNSSVWDIMQDK